jgi:hypothetical protein
MAAELSKQHAVCLGNVVAVPSSTMGNETAVFRRLPSPAESVLKLFFSLSVRTKNPEVKKKFSFHFVSGKFCSKLLKYVI